MRVLETEKSEKDFGGSTKSVRTSKTLVVRPGTLSSVEPRKTNPISIGTALVKEDTAAQSRPGPPSSSQPAAPPRSRETVQAPSFSKFQSAIKDEISWGTVS